MKKFINYAVAMATLLALGLTSCHSGDDDDYFEPLNPEDKELVSSNVPSEGWSGDSQNGIFKYAPAEYEPEDINSYYAFNMKNGVCQSAVLNLVMESATQARQLAQILNNGTWANTDDDDDDDYDDGEYKSRPGNRPFDMTRSSRRLVDRVYKSRSGVSLPMPVQQDGKVIYIVLPNFKGLSDIDIREVMELWNGNYYIVPDRIIFGKYQNGVYTCNNMHGMNIDYKIETGFNSDGFCTKYTTSVTLPTESWAELYYEMYEEQMWDFEEQFGQRPDLQLNGNTVTLDAIIIGDISQAQIDAMIYALDWLNNCPFLYRFFGE